MATARPSRRKVSNSVTIVDVAKAAGVSYSTVSRVFSGYEFVNEETRERVVEAANKLGYVVNLQARSLAGGRSNIVGLLAPGLDNGYITEIVSGIDQELAQHGLDLMLYTTHRYPGKEAFYVKTIANGLVDGLILLVPLVTTNYIQALPRQDFPYVLIDQTNSTSNSPSVDATNWQGAYDATTYLIKLGHRRIGFITGYLELSSATERLDGYRAALQHHRIPLDENLTVMGDYLTTGGYAGAQKLLNLAERPSAIFASNDLEAIGVMNAAHQRGLRIPGDISIIGFDDIPQASLVYPRLTTVRQPLVQIGQVAVRLLLERIDTPEKDARRVTLSTELVIRESCAPPAG
ncbi:MAG TPA: LacI family DNA-binding transcriptional regulator [Aggregatilineales bacterium]|nr:LacI family DNA-binding transcriptional regulator [Anaerolineae bacterium]HUN07676.1 LacI family DNA-binding transcriptional regulator [Aggregatilineales bacterium]